MERTKIEILGINFATDMLENTTEEDRETP
jgi:hypothetical protein